MTKEELLCDLRNSQDEVEGLKKDLEHAEARVRSIRFRLIAEDYDHGPQMELAIQGARSQVLPSDYREGADK